MGRGRHVLIVALGIAIGLGVAGVGYLVGKSSYQVTYQTVADAHVTHYISGTDDNHHESYFQVAEGSALFYVYEGDFSPTFNATALGNSGHIAFVFPSDSGMSIDVTSDRGTHLTGNAYRVIAIETLDNGPQLFTTATYTQHPNGYFNDRSTIAYLLYAIGGLILLCALVSGGQALVLAGAILGGVAVPSVAWLILLSFVSAGAGASSANAGALRNLTIAEVAAGAGALIGMVAGFVIAVGLRREERTNERRRVRREKHAVERREQQVRATGALASGASTWSEWNNRGNNFDTLKRYDEALQAYDQALALMPPGDPNAWALWNNRAETLKNAQRYAEALAANDRAFALQPALVPVLATRALVLLFLKRYADAIPFYERVLQQAPDTIVALNNLSVAYAEVNRYDDALRLCNRVLALDPDNAIAAKNRPAFQTRPSPGTVTVHVTDDD